MRNETNMQYNDYLFPNRRNFRNLKEIEIKKHDGDVRFKSGSENMAVSCMRNVSGRNLTAKLVTAWLLYLSRGTSVRNLYNASVRAKELFRLGGKKRTSFQYQKCIFPGPLKLICGPFPLLQLHYGKVLESFVGCVPTHNRFIAHWTYWSEFGFCNT